MNNASARGKRPKREVGCAAFPSFQCVGSDTEPRSLRVSCPQTTALQMNAILVPWHLNPCCLMSLSNSRGDYFFWIIITGMVGTVSSSRVTGVLVGLHGRPSLTQRYIRNFLGHQRLQPSCSKGACEQSVFWVNTDI